MVEEKLPDKTLQLPVSEQVRQPADQIEAPSFMEKIKVHKFKILSGVLLAFILTGTVYSAYRLGQRQVKPPPQLTPSLSSPETPGQGEENCAGMTLSEARGIALGSECVEEGSLKETHSCNEYTGTWWIDLDIEKPGCAPACVINVATKKTEINWRCTGLIP